VYKVPEPELYDVAIIGAGPAGTAVARTITGSDISFILIDKEEFPRNKPCAGVLPPRIFSELDIPEELCERRLLGYKLFSPGGTVIESKFSRPGLIVDRKRFDEHLVKSLDCDLINDNISKLAYHEDYVELEGRQGTYHARIIVGADGVNSIVRRTMKLNHGTIAMAAQCEVSLSEQEINNLIGDWFEVYYVIPYGYGWLSPLKNSVKVGVGGVSDELKMDPFESLKGFMDHPEVKNKIGESEIGNPELHRIPMSGPQMQLTADRGLVVGDAGGFVYPGTGEGIYYAVKSGRLAGEALVSAFTAGGLDQQLLEQLYFKKLKENGLLSLRDVDFIDRVLSSVENVEKYLQRLKRLTQHQY
jgi:geranylgeranyl reductase family protein